MAEIRGPGPDHSGTVSDDVDWILGESGCDSFAYVFRPSLVVLYLAVLFGQFPRSVQPSLPTGLGVFRSVGHLRLAGLVSVPGSVLGVSRSVASDVA